MSAAPKPSRAEVLAAVSLDGDVDGYGACLYVGGRGLTRQAWSVMAPDYRHGGWARDLDARRAFATGAECGRAPAPNTTEWHACKDGYCDFHKACVADSHGGALAFTGYQPRGFQNCGFWQGSQTNR